MRVVGRLGLAEAGTIHGFKVGESASAHLARKRVALACCQTLHTPVNKIQFEYLADRPECVPQVIAWWHTVWADRMGSDIPRLEAQLRQSLGRDELPVHLLATAAGRPVGTAVLKRQELADLYPDRQYWLGSVYVVPEYRHGRIASQLAERVIELAREQELPHLYLQTVNLNGGLYARLGWRPVERFDYRGETTLLMLRELGTR